MSSRLELHSILKSVVENVYFQPPESVKLKYPCIVYSMVGDLTSHANNRKYKRNTRYTVTLIDKNPDSIYVDALSDLPYCAFDRTFTKDNLNHYVFTLFF